jgi:hypothetical protein
VLNHPKATRSIGRYDGRTSGFGASIGILEVFAKTMPARFVMALPGTRKQWTARLLCIDLWGITPPLRQF